CWLVVSSVEVLPESFSVGSGGKPFAVLLVRVSLRTVSRSTVPWWFWWRFSQDRFASTVLLATVFSLMVRVVWVVHSGEGSSQDRPLSLLVEVFPRSALCLFRAIVVLPLWFEVDELSLFPVGLSVLQSAWALSVEVLCLWPCVWLLRWPACLVVYSEFLSCTGGTSCVPVVGWFASFFTPCVLLQIVVWAGAGVAYCALSGLLSFACGFWQVSGEEYFITMCCAVCLFVRFERRFTTSLGVGGIERSPIGGRHVVLDLCGCFGSYVVVRLSGGWHAGTRVELYVRMAGVLPIPRWFSTVRGVGESGSRWRSLLSVRLVTARPIG
ncbi:hypothetical protein Taro_023926, partial [Colocasia esculenta]|nr:hypothetical protein [Colocasia esculenta]